MSLNTYGCRKLMLSTRYEYHFSMLFSVIQGRESVSIMVIPQHSIEILNSFYPRVKVYSNTNIVTRSLL